MGVSFVSDKMLAKTFTGRVWSLIGDAHDDLYRRRVGRKRADKAYAALCRAMSRATNQERQNALIAIGKQGVVAPELLRRLGELAKQGRAEALKWIGPASYPLLRVFGWLPWHYGAQ